MNISIEKFVSWLAEWNIFGGLMMQDYRLGPSIFTREDGSFRPNKEKWTAATTDFSDLAPVEDQIRVLDRLITTYVMPTQKYVFQRLLDVVIILQGWPEEAQWGKIDILDSQTPNDTYFAPRMDQDVRVALLEFYDIFLPDQYGGKTPDDLSTKKWLADIEAKLKGFVKSTDPVRNKQLNQIIRKEPGKQRTLFHITNAIVNEIKRTYIEIHEVEKKPSWPKGRVWGNEYNWACYLVFPGYTSDQASVESKGFWRQRGMAQFLEGSSAADGERLCQLLGMCSYFPQEFLQKTVNSMADNWLTTTHPPETTVSHESETWYTIWKRSLQGENFNNFNVDVRNERSVSAFVQEFSKMEDKYAPVRNTVIGPEESPVLGSGGFNTALSGSEEDQDGMEPTRRESFQGVTTTTTYNLAPLVAAGAVLGGFYYLVT